MNNQETKVLTFPDMKRIKQESGNSCGPAVLQMLLSFLGKDITQNEVIEAMDVAQTIDENGSQISDMQLGITNIDPNLRFWYKFEAEISDLERIVNRFRYPVGVEWQGIFVDWNEYDDDEGHYSIVTGLEADRNLIKIADPYIDPEMNDRLYKISKFEDRWWDSNEVIHPVTGALGDIEDYHAMFIVTKKDEVFPLELGMKHDRLG